MNLEDRVASLERRAARWRWASVALGVLVLAGGAMQARQPDHLKVRVLEIVDDKGKSRGVLGYSLADQEVSLILRDADGKARIASKVGPKRAEFKVNDREEKAGVLAVVDDTGSILNLSNRNGPGRIVTMGVGTGGAHFYMHGEKGRNIFGADEEGVR